MCSPPSHQPSKTQRDTSIFDDEIEEKKQKRAEKRKRNSCEPEESTKRLGD